MVFRRHPIRRLPAIGRRFRPLRRAAINLLRDANQSFDEGRWLQAAEQLERLAAAAEQRALPQSALLFLRAGQARLEHGDQQTGVSHLKKAIKLLAQFDQHEQLYRIRPRIAESLNQLGLERDAAEINQAIHKILDQHPTEGFPSIQKPARFPPKCSACGGTLRPDEMELLDSRTGVCGYCGSVSYGD